MKMEHLHVDIYLQSLSGEDEKWSVDSSPRTPARYIKRRKESYCGREFIREIMAKELGCPPPDIEIHYEEDGRPFVKMAGTKIKAPYFSLSHSKDQLVIAVSQERPVGIDLEFLDLSRDFSSLFHYFRPSEHNRDPLSFYQAWTTYECRLKANTNDGIWDSAQIRSLRFDQYILSCCLAKRVSDPVFDIKMYPAQESQEFLTPCKDNWLKSQI